jgi:hypothetical protein
MFVSLEALSDADPQYDWDFDIGLDAEVANFGGPHVNIAFTYEAVLGSELQPFDPWHSNYTIDLLAASGGDAEFGVLFRHVSRHLGDRAKDFGIAWNDLGLQGRLLSRRGPWLAQTRGAVLGTVMRNFVDYAADLSADAAVRREITARVSLTATAAVHLRLVKQGLLDTGANARGHQTGGKFEAGIRLHGHVAAVEIVGGLERRVDPGPFDLEARSWAFAAVRLVSR